MMKKKLVIKITAQTLLIALFYQLVFPLTTYALTTGPSQPEVQSFEPVGTTNMVDLFTGDFTYNIPLMDIEGYPVNIFYHSGVTMEQEASWVGLGWNINPGEINRSVRGVPDDFNGDRIEKTINIRPEKEYRLGIGSKVAKEFFGKEYTASIGAGLYLCHNNYRGMSAGISVNGGFKTPVVSAGLNIGIGSQTGADIDANASVEVSKTLKHHYLASAGIGGGTGFNSRQGLKDITFSGGAGGGYLQPIKNKDQKRPLSAKFSTTLNIPIGIQNYVPVMTNTYSQQFAQYQIEVGKEFKGYTVSGYLNVSLSNTTFDKYSAPNAFGYLYMENANSSSMMDFCRDKDGMYNRTMKNLPAASLGYDIYTVNGQGTGGMFKPYRNDLGTIYDPLVVNENKSKSPSVGLEFGFGDLFKVGADITFAKALDRSGSWYNMRFGGDVAGTLYEKVYFKQGGETTYNPQQEMKDLFNADPQYLDKDFNTLRAQGGSVSMLLSDMLSSKRYWRTQNVLNDRASRANNITYLTGAEAAVPDVAQTTTISSYHTAAGKPYTNPEQKQFARYRSPFGSDTYPALSHHISEFTQTLSDGRRYIYGIPAMNNVVREVSFAVNENKANEATGLVGFIPGLDDQEGNHNGRDYFCGATHTPAHAHSYLLTSVLSADYVDIQGDGPTDDDLGSFVKFNYTLTDNDYRWKMPYPKGQAQYNPGFWTDLKDGKGNYISGSRQQWHIRTIESKNYVAEFYISPRKDGAGINDAVLPASSEIAKIGSINLSAPKSGGPSISYKLDSVALYNKHDRYVNGDAAIPVKTVILQYDYSLCPGIPNTTDPASGKLTLRKIYTRYGRSDKNLLSPYVFQYSSSNPAYNFGSKDRWGNFKPDDPKLSNYLFPYTTQPSDKESRIKLDESAASWNLTGIGLPSGGKIDIAYENDDYSFVQNKRSMQMVMLEGVGNSTRFQKMNFLYLAKNMNDYVYFKRNKEKEIAGLSLRDNYLEDQRYLYYCFNLDIVGKGRYEFIKGYAEIEDIGYCENDPASPYAYIKLKRDKAGNMSLPPATILGINNARYYLPHILYPGSDDDASDFKNIVRGLQGSLDELLNIFNNPFAEFTSRGLARNIRLSHSWLRLQCPGLTKSGGGLRVKKLTVSDNWNAMAGANESVYGKTYDYTTNDQRYGLISSGVASYEPQIGNDENPWRQPLPYSAEGGRLLPSIDFFQEEPVGESFFPGPVVGYSNVKIRSIHADYGRSSQSMEEHTFYTARDFPVEVKYTDKVAPKPEVRFDGLNNYRSEMALQGHVVMLNDMHGKPKSSFTYLVGKNGAQETLLPVKGEKYNYRTDNVTGKLDNTVAALIRKRGTQNTYAVEAVKLGQDIEVTLDSRERYHSAQVNRVQVNASFFTAGTFILASASLFVEHKGETRIYQSLVTSKIVQQYGLLQSVESFDHESRVVTENVLYDAETGGVLLTKTNNQFDDNQYQLRYPAHMAYEGMRPSYTNVGFAEQADSLVVNDPLTDGFLYTDNLDNYSPGDELLVTVPGLKNFKYKLWVLGKAVNPVAGKSEPPSDDSVGYVMFWAPYPAPVAPKPAYCPEVDTPSIPIRVAIFSQKTKDTIRSGYVSRIFPDADGRKPSFGSGRTYSVKLPPGDYGFVAKAGYNATEGAYRLEKSDLFSITRGQTIEQPFVICKTPTRPGSSGPSASRTIPAGRCALLVAPRFKGRFTTASPDVSTLMHWGQYKRKVSYGRVDVKIVRSGRRNMLDKMVQNAVLTRLPYERDVNDLFTHTAFNDLVTLSAQTYTDAAQSYDGFRNSYKVPGTDITQTLYNPFVTGVRGNFRALATYVPIANRKYASLHTRTDGTFVLSQSFWSFRNARPIVDCSDLSDVLVPFPTTSRFWKNAGYVSIYDVHGNALEERDAVGNFSAAQFGYNKALPVAVVYNARQPEFLFDGFEDYNMPVSVNGKAFWTGSALASSIVPLFLSPLKTVQANGQSYELPTLVSGALSLSRGVSHTGNYSLYAAAPGNLPLDKTEAGRIDISKQGLANGKKILINLWAKSSGKIDPSLFKIKVGRTVYPMVVKAFNVDGWNLLECTIAGGAAADLASLEFPGNVWLDDLRILPVDANMKSFVYDPYTFRLMAQLDENHFASYYEYDQEGILVRTRKETDKGVLTIMESRRGSVKNGK